ncbi:hypothetical protein [Rhodococcus koreensis]|uniref:hypothetical protein n=1 Tax=Rhodococcus koreensis TaxID=99653 RepID=UPI001F1235B9|nr:hypothetical protein [Rhodococcus koreensis]
MTDLVQTSKLPSDAEPQGVDYGGKFAYMPFENRRVTGNAWSIAMVGAPGVGASRRVMSPIMAHSMNASEYAARRS